jgi:hypothetical protein
MIVALGILSSMFVAAPLKANQHKLQLVKRNGLDLPFFYPKSTLKSVINN